MRVEWPGIDAEFQCAKLAVEALCSWGGEKSEGGRRWLIILHSFHDLGLCSATNKKAPRADILISQIGFGFIF